LFFVDVGKLH
jgi:hypothetical protein